MTAIPLLSLQGRNAYIEYAANSALNTHLVLGKVKLPVRKETYDDFAAGATNGSIEMMTGTEACMLGFDLKGIQPAVLPLTNLPLGDRLKITVYAVLVNEYATSAEGREQQVVSTSYGRLNAEIGEMEGALGTDYELHSISKYNMMIGNTEIYRFNIQAGGWQDIGGQRQRINQMLGITG